MKINKTIAIVCLVSFISLILSSVVYFSAGKSGDGALAICEMSASVFFTAIFFLYEKEKAPSRKKQVC